MYSQKLISIIIPVYNEQENIVPLYQRLCTVISTLKNQYEFEFIFMDNHSTDNSFNILTELARQDSRIKGVRFSRNFGYQRSIYTGYLYSKGHATIQVDCDMQDPPELILEFIKYWEQGDKVVYGIRRSRQESRWMEVIRKLFYRLISYLSETALPHDAGDFRLVDRCIVEELKKIEDMQPYLRGAIANIGFQQRGIVYDRAARLHGESKFKFKDLFRLAFDGIVNHSITPLRIATYVGIVVASITCLSILGYAIAHFIYQQEWPKGFATLTILILFSLSLNSLFLGIIGEYLGRIYRQVKKQPITIIEKELNNSSLLESAVKKNDIRHCEA